MARAHRYLTPEQAASVYDRVGRWQDTQGYERPAVDALLRDGGFDHAHDVLEVGCGTGLLAARLLTERLPPTAHYVALEVSRTMVGLARDRLRPWADRVRVVQVDGRTAWPVTDAVTDRVVATYVLDLLSPEAIRSFFAESARVLRPGGLVATVSLAERRRGAPGLVCAAWSSLWRIDPRLTAGCRPLDTGALLPSGWHARTHRALTRWGISSTVLIAEPPAV